MRYNSEYNKHCSIFILLFLFITFNSCDNSSPTNKDRISNHVQLGKVENDSIALPGIHKFSLNELEKKIPGQHPYKEPEIIKAKAPKITRNRGIYGIIPGESYLPQTKEDAILGKKLIKSKAPLQPKLGDPISQKFLNSPFVNKHSEILIEPKSYKIGADTLKLPDTVYIQKGDDTGLRNPATGELLKAPEIVKPGVPIVSPSLVPKYKSFAVANLKYLDVNEGMTSSYIHSMCEDKNGNLWFGTYGSGVSCYDGKAFMTYGSEQGLNNNSIRAIHEDRRGMLWFGSVGKGLVCYDGQNFIKYTSAQGLSDNNVWSIVEDDQGYLWFGTDKGVNRFDGKQFVHYTMKQGLSNNYILSMHIDKEGILWLGTYGGGFNRFDGESFTHITTENGLSNNRVMSLYTDHQGILWIGTWGGGLNKYDGKEFIHYSVENGLGGDIIRTILEDNNGKLWIGSYGGGMVCYDGKRFTQYKEEHGLSNNYVIQILEDRNGNLWFGTDGGGVNRYDGGSFIHFTKEQGLCDVYISSILEDDDGSIWLGTDGSGLDHFTGDYFINYSKENGLKDNTILSIEKDKSDNIWLSSGYDGLQCFNGDSFKGYSLAQGLSNSKVWDIVTDDDGKIWIGTDRGVNCFDGDAFFHISKNDGLENEFVITIFKDSQNRMWFGTDGGGVFLYDGQYIRNVSTSQGLSDNHVNNIFEDKDGNIWVASRDKVSILLKRYVDDYLSKIYIDDEGLAHSPKLENMDITKGGILYLGIQQGLPANLVMTISSDNDDNIWIGGEKGIVRLKETSKDDKAALKIDNVFYKLRVYSTREGFLGGDVYGANSVITDKKGNTWWGSGKMLTKYIPEFDKVDTLSPMIHIRDIHLFFENVEWENVEAASFDGLSPWFHLPENLSLPHYQNHISFNFIGISWNRQDKIKYQFMLEGENENWSPLSTTTEATFSNLSHGIYTFKLRALNDDGIWSETIEYSFEIRTPWWLTWWFMTSVVVLIILGIIMVFRLRLAALRQRQKELEQQVKSRTHQLALAKEEAEEATKSKSQFLASMSHEIRTPMNAVIGLSHLTMQTELSAKQRDYISKIQSSGKALLGIINDILDFSKIEAGKLDIENTDFDLETIFNDVATVITYKSHEKGLEIIFDICDDVPLLLNGDPLRIGQILINLSNNAVKFTEEGEIVISVEVEKEIDDDIWLKFSVKDSGIGLTEEQLGKLFQSFSQADKSTTRKYGGTGLGLAICKNLVEMMDGKIWAESEYGHGSTFIFYIKMKKRDEQKFVQMVPVVDMKGMNVLLCDDNTTSLEVLKTMLEALTFNVTAVNSGEKALLALKNSISKPFDFMILDWKMPEMNGIEVAKKIKNMELNSSIPIIMMVNAYTSEDIINKVERLKLEGLITKPVNHSMMFDAIMKAFGKEVESKTKFRGIEENYLEDLNKRKGANILLVEDNEINQQVAAEMLESVGMRVKIANNGLEAVNTLKENADYDLIFMDLQMPVMDGMTATRKILEDEKLKDIPILAMTADVVGEIKEKCYKAGMKGFVNKPVDPSNVFESIVKWVKEGEREPVKIKEKNDTHHDDIHFNGLDGIDVDLGLRRVNNNRKLYQSLLFGFYDSNINFIDSLKFTLEKGQEDVALRMVHTVKGVSGNIAANLLHEKTKILDDVLNEKSYDDLDTLLNDYKQFLDPVLETIHNYRTLVDPTYGKEEIAEDNEDLDIEKFKETFEELQELIAKRKPASKKKMEELLLIPGIGKYRKQLQAVAKELKAYKFNEAKELISKIEIL